MISAPSSVVDAASVEVASSVPSDSVAAPVVTEVPDVDCVAYAEKSIVIIETTAAKATTLVKPRRFINHASSF